MIRGQATQGPFPAAILQFITFDNWELNSSAARRESRTGPPYGGRPEDPPLRERRAGPESFYDVPRAALPAEARGAELGWRTPERLAVDRRRSGMSVLLLPARHGSGQPVGRLRRHRPHVVIGAHVLADRLQPFQDALPLRPVELPQVWTKSLNEWVLEHRLAIRLRNEKAVQSDAQRFGNFFKRAEARS